MSHCSTEPHGQSLATTHLHLSASAFILTWMNKTNKSAIKLEPTATTFSSLWKKTTPLWAVEPSPKHRSSFVSDGRQTAIRTRFTYDQWASPFHTSAQIGKVTPFCKRNTVRARHRSTRPQNILEIQYKVKVCQKVACYRQDRKINGPLQSLQPESVLL